MWEDPPLIWATNLLLAVYIRTWEKEVLFLCLLVLTLTGKSILSLALEPTSLRFPCVLKTSWNIQPCGLNNFCILGLSVGRLSLLDKLDHSW